jgi:hypothetical protein
VVPRPVRVRLRYTSARVIDAVASREAYADWLRHLARARVPSLVVPGPRDDAVIVKTENPDCELVAPFVSGPEAVDLAARYGYDTVQVAITAFGPAARIYGPITDPRPVIEHARERGLRVAGAVTMVSYLDDVAGTLAKLAGADEITLFDGPGAVGPEAFAALVRETRSAAPGATVGIHPHNTFGLAVACAVQSGADTVEVAVNGYCGGPGNADLAATAVALEALYGMDTGIRLDHLTGLARAAEELTGNRLALHHPITGRAAFHWGDGEWVTREVAIDPLMHNCVAAALVGNIPSH